MYYTVGRLKCIILSVGWRALCFGYVDVYYTFGWLTCIIILWID